RDRLEPVLLPDSGGCVDDRLDRQSGGLLHGHAGEYTLDPGFGVRVHQSLLSCLSREGQVPGDERRTTWQSVPKTTISTTGRNSRASGTAAGSGGTRAAGSTSTSPSASCPGSSTSTTVPRTAPSTRGRPSGIRTATRPRTASTTTGASTSLPRSATCSPSS